MNKKELIELFMKQHDELQNDLLLIDTYIGKIGFGENTLNTLQKFKKDLIGHLSLEDSEFYPNYLRQLRERGEETKMTDEFIGEMNRIKLIIITFLDKYSVKENIDRDQTLFLSELSQVSSTLNLRIETEEDGVYGMYLLM